VTQDTPAFFTLDRGTVGTDAALVAPVDGRYRMLAAAAAPSAVDPESVLEDLAWRVARTDASLAGTMDGWREWSRLEVRTARAPRAVLVAATAGTGELLERAFEAAGWLVQERFFTADPEVTELGSACLEPAVDAVVVAGREEAEESEREAALRSWARASSLARFRDDLAVMACGPFAQRPEGIPEERLFSLPAPAPVPGTSTSTLREAAAQVGRHLVLHGRPAPGDGRAALRTAIVSLAAVLDSRVDGIEVGAAGGSRTVAAPGGERGHGVYASAGFIPPALLEADGSGESVLRWSTLGGDPATRLDALRELALQPWAGLDREGAQLRLAALRAAIERLEQAWDGAALGDATGPGADMLVLSGGGFAALPPAAASLAVIDGARRRGAMSLVHDHAGVLAPLGALPVEDDRRRLLADLMADALLPLGSAVVTGAIERERREPQAVEIRVSSVLGDERVRLEPDRLQLVDLPPGISARLGLDPGTGSVLGVEGRTLGLEVVGGLGGLYLDSRPVPLDLPDSGEARRTRLEAWEAAAWAGSER
jgi:hypothetical protein